MSTVVGGDVSEFGPRTWGSLRGVIYNRTISGSPIDILGFRNVEYLHGFKTTEGNGLIRTEGSPLYFGSASSGPNFNAYTTGSGTTGKFSSDYETSYLGWIVNEDRSQLIGETAVLSSGSITIEASAFVSPFQTITISGTPGINSIGKLTAF